MADTAYLKGREIRIPKINERSVSLLVNTTRKYALTAGIQQTKSFLYNFEKADSDAPFSRSYLGTDVFSFFSVINPENQDDPIAGSYFDNVGRQITYPSINVDTCLFNVSQTKNIVKTQIQGLNGTIKEYISDGDFEITCRGVIVSENPNQYPDAEVDKFLKIMSVPAAIRVTSPFLNNLEIDDVVIESYTLDQTEGFYNSQLFTIKMISEKPIELTL
jgi:hypothetical protein